MGGSKYLGNTISESLQNLKAHLKKVSINEKSGNKNIKYSTFDTREQHTIGWRSKSIENRIGDLRINVGLRETLDYNGNDNKYNCIDLPEDPLMNKRIRMSNQIELIL